MAGLRDVLGKNREQFTGHFCRKLLGYALGRSVMPGDKELLARMSAAVQAREGRVSAAVVEIVTSRQFLNRRNELPAVSSLSPVSTRPPPTLP
jgi:hypothetical protein